MTDLPPTDTAEPTDLTLPPRPLSVEEFRAARARIKAWAAQQRRHPFEFQGVSLKAELRRYWSAEALRPRQVPGVIVGRGVPSLRVRYGTRCGASGRSFSGWPGRIVITIGHDASVASVMELLLHEAVHCSLPREFHSERFILRLVRAASELWNITIAKPLETTERGYRTKLAYAVDDRIVAALAADHARGVNLPYQAPPPAPHPAPSPDERRAALVARRHQHAAAMLAKNEKAFKLAQSRVQKWRKRVSYYEKVAAKRGSTS